MSHVITEVAEAEPVRCGEGNMSGAVMRGAAALSGSEAISRMKGTCRNLGSPVGASGKVTGGGQLVIWERELKESKPLRHA